MHTLVTWGMSVCHCSVSCSCFFLSTSLLTFITLARFYAGFVSCLSLTFVRVSRDWYSLRSILSRSVAYSFLIPSFLHSPPPFFFLLLYFQPMLLLNLRLYFFFFKFCYCCLSFFRTFFWFMFSPSCLPANSFPSFPFDLFLYLFVSPPFSDILVKGPV